MALVQSQPATQPRRYAFEPADDLEDWYRHVDEWDFSTQSKRKKAVRRTSTRIPARPPPPPPAVINAEATTQITESIWKLLNDLERDVSLAASKRPTTKERKETTRTRARLATVLPEIERLEGAISELAREGPSGHDVRRQMFVVDCKTAILDLEDDYSKDAAAEYGKAFDRVKSLMLQYRDLVDPFTSCLICSEAIRSSGFPKRVTATCQHIVSSCYGCLRSWVAASLEERGFAQLKCMECNAILHGDDIRAIASQEVYRRYDDLSARKVLHDTPEFYFCLNPKCKSGQLHYGGARFECHACKNQICAKHGVAWHEGETCTEYDARRTDAHKEYDAAEDLKVKIARACPQCEAPIEKNGGCAHMNCWKCDHHFQWDDAQAYFPKAFFWERDQEKLSEATYDRRKRAMPVRWFRRLFAQRKQPVRPRVVPIDPTSMLEDGCFD